MIPRIRPAVLVLITLLAYLQPALCSSNDGKTQYVEYQNPDGQTVYLRNDRRPSLYTGNYGDCLGNSLINVTRFDAAYYKDNMTVLFHLAGNSQLNNESLVMYIGVYAYGSSRFDLLFNPCHANINSLCPLNSSIPIVAQGIVPIAPMDVANIPSIALSIPNFEGQAILRVFANSTESEIACYSAVVTNGNSFGQPKSVGTILGLFTLVAVIASFATAIYGEAVPTMRLHYAHSLSVGIVFAVFQHIYFTGALSMNWPAVLVGWWENFAWSGGMIYSSSMQNSIDRLIGANIGSTYEVGAAASDSNNANVGGGYDISQIYKRMIPSGLSLPSSHPLLRDLATEIYRDPLALEIRRRELLEVDTAETRVRRAQASASATPGLVDRQSGYRWYGHAVGPGMPLPGNYSGMAGTLAEENIPVSNAFMTGFLWFLILLVGVTFAVVAFKGVLELLVRYKRMNQDRLLVFRKRWLQYTTAVALRTCYIAFFLLTFLTVFEFTFRSSAGVKVIAALVFLIFPFGLAGIAAYACYYKKHFVNDGTQAERKKLIGIIPWASSKKSQPSTTQEATTPDTSDEKKTPRTDTGHADEVQVGSVIAGNIHDNEDYTTKFGWLASRFRRTRWWFFTAWLLYEFVRACFYAGASGHPLVQVFGILVVEFIAFVFIVWAQPFEGRRLNILVVYCLGFSKVSSVALSAAFDTKFNLPRITTTIIGIVIIVIQGILTIITLIAIVVGAISSYMSICRNKEDFRPRKWHGLQQRYFDHLDAVVNDLPREPKDKTKTKKERKQKRSKQPEESVSQAEAVSAFEVRGIKRLNKIEDEDEEFAAEMRTQDRPDSHLGITEAPTTIDEVVHSGPSEHRAGAETPITRSRTSSMRSLSQSNLPKGARPSRPSWSAQDFNAFISPTTEDTRPRSTSLGTDPADTTLVTASPSPKRKGGLHSRTSSLRSNRKVEAITAPVINADELRVGGEVSTRDTIGPVPAPTVRPRAGSLRGGSRPSSFADYASDSNEQEHVGFSSRGSRYMPAAMTPAQERDEWIAASVGATKDEEEEVKGVV